MPVPKNAKQPQDRAIKAEAKGQHVEFDYEGVAYSIDRDNADNLEILEFVEDAQYIKAIRGYLGVEQWAKWKDANRDDKGRVSAGHFEPFVQACMDALGGGSGESSPS